MDAQTIFENSVQVILSGKHEGNYSPRGETTFEERVRCVREFLGHSIVAPRCNFTTRWVEWPSTDGAVWEEGDGVRWTRQGYFADGVILGEDAGALVAGFSADCPYGVVQWKDGRVGLCHLGLRCLVPTDGVPGILETTGITSDARVYVVPGIGPCCYGEREAGNFNDVFTRYPELKSLRVTRGPRAGQRAIDLYTLIELILKERCGVEDVTFDRRCTACEASRTGGRLWYSHVYGETGRNLIAVKRIP